MLVAGVAREGDREQEEDGVGRGGEREAGASPSGRTKGRGRSASKERAERGEEGEGGKPSLADEEKGCLGDLTCSGEEGAVNRVAE